MSGCALIQNGHPLVEAARLALQQLGLDEPDWQVELHSTIPIASGLGSGAAVTVAIVRALASAVKRHLSVADVSGICYEVERLHHGTPSGVDNTVIAYGQPVYFVRGQAPEPFPIGRPFWLAIGDTGIASPTRIAVGDVRARWQAETGRYEALFDRVAGIVAAAKSAISAGEPQTLGPADGRQPHAVAGNGRLVSRAGYVGGCRMRGRCGWRQALRRRSRGVT